MRTGSAKFSRGATQRGAARWARDSLARACVVSSLQAVATATRRTTTQLVPFTGGHAAEGFDDFGVELPAGPLFQFSDCRAVRLGLAVDAVARDGIEGVGDGEDARVQIYLIPSNSKRVARARDALVMLRH